MGGLLRCIGYLVILGVSAFLLGRIFPPKWFHYDQFPWRLWKLEQGGDIYRKIRIYKWKEKFLDMSKIFPGILPSKKLPHHFHKEQVERMIVETCIAECIHGILFCRMGMPVPVGRGGRNLHSDSLCAGQSSVLSDPEV